ncbi:hypothetical protein PG993_010310 [Apiospora rasikravindrae]|uniref:Glutaminase A n=1 Tax=Apiospora rasikravindrae TaxID=990691 RepID=A0ABR1SNP2_9PEZI
MRFDIVSAIGALAALANASTLTPKTLPLVVRNPYLSTWLPSARDEPWKQWPIFYTGSTFGFAVMAAVPETNSVYPLLGRPHDFLGDKSGRYKTAFPHYNGPTFDASTTNLTYTIANATGDGEVKVILSFMSPITPTSTFRQALPASYMSVYVEGNLDISIFCDINGEWVSGNRDNHIKWELSESKSSKASASHLKTWKIERQYPELLTENWDHAEWGTLYFTGPGDAQHQSGEANAIRRQFSKHGELTNKVDSSFRKMFDDEPLFAFSKEFKLSNSSRKAVATDSMLFTFSLIQDPVVQFASARGLTQMRPLWASYFFTAEDMIHYHYHDFKTASSLAYDYSETLAKDAFASGSADYRDIAALSARQVFGATQWAGTPDNPILFLKEISSNGNFQTVDVIFPAFPFFLSADNIPTTTACTIWGTHFPNATGHSDGNDEYMPVEECGNMLIMGLALANAMKDGSQPAFALDASTTAVALRAGPKEFSSSVDQYGMDRTWEDMGTTGVKAAQRWVSRSYSLWKKWTGYLVRESLIPANQLCTDDFAGWLANQTNLALKGIVGIKAMADLSELVGSSSEAHEYSRIADKYIDKWQELGISRDGTHAKLSYTWEGSWTTIYNLYADALLCFHLPGSNGNKSSTFIPEKVYQMQSDWYHNVLQRYGLPLDQRSLQTKSDWEFFAAAVASKQVRTEILQSVAKWVNETSTHLPLTDLYDTEGDGGFPSGIEFKARPVVGGHFAFLALERACGGKAAQALGYLDLAEPAKINVEAALEADDSGPSEL